MPQRIDDLPDQTVQGLWSAHEAGEVIVEDELDETIIRSAELLAERQLWMWMFQSSSTEGSCWKDLDGNFWIVHPQHGEVREL